MKRLTIASTLLAILSLSACGNTSNNESSIKDTPQIKDNAAISFSFDSINGSYTKENVSSSMYKIDYVFSSENAEILFKKPNDIQEICKRIQI